MIDESLVVKSNLLNMNEIMVSLIGKELKIDFGKATCDCKVYYRF